MVHSVNIGSELEKEASAESLPDSFQPDLIVTALDGSSKDSAKLSIPSIKNSKSTIADSSIFHCEYYLTNVRPESERQTFHILPQAQPYLKFGRPKLPQIFEQVVALCTAESIDRVAVVTCGPPPMTQEVHHLCSKSTSGKLKFDLHVEEFGF